MCQPGDLVWVAFDDPAFGHEQAGRRPALVLSQPAYNDISSFVLVCPVTRNMKPWPFKVPLSPDCGLTGAVLVDQIRAVDRRRIVSTVIAQISPKQIQDIRTIVAAILGLELED